MRGSQPPGSFPSRSLVNSLVRGTQSSLVLGRLLQLASTQGAKAPLQTFRRDTSQQQPVLSATKRQPIW